MLNNTIGAVSPRHAAEQVRENYEVRPTTLVSYRSRGRLLVIGGAAKVAKALDILPPRLHPHILLVDVCPPELAERLGAGEIDWLDQAGALAVSGYLGAFRVTAEFDGKLVEINPLPLAPGANPAELGYVSVSIAPSPHGGRSGWGRTNEQWPPWLNRPHLSSPVGGGTQVGASDVHSTVSSPYSHFDLILDLQEFPSIALPVPPIGYCAPEDGERSLLGALEKLAELVGEFDKPKYFEHKAETCAHSASRIEGCPACLDVCAAGAIASHDFQISVNPYLCQGCGDCSTVCPAGAMNYLYPHRSDTLNRLRAMLDAWFEAGGKAPAPSPVEGPVLLLHDSEAGAAWVERHGHELPARFLPYPLEALGAAGMEIWLSALAYGCEQVVLLAAGELTEMTVRSLEEQLRFAAEFLAGMGYESSLIRFIRPETNAAELTTDALLSIPPPSAQCRLVKLLPPVGEGWDGGDPNSQAPIFSPPPQPSPGWGREQKTLTKRNCPSGEARWGRPQKSRDSSFDRPRARFAGDDDKRTVIRLAIEHLHRHAPERPKAAPLSTGAAFGEIRVDTSRCTLCMPCVSICPERALADGGDLPKLKFIEANCVQCGLCQKACPENAIELAPCYLFDQTEARRARLLHEEDVFRCLECAKPFATASMIETITGRLKDHPMFQGDKLRRLQMCEVCRVKTMFSDRSRKL